MLAEEKNAILARLRSAEGHLHSVVVMVDKGQNCEEVLHQLHAVQAAIQASGRLLLQYQVQESIETACHNDCPEERSAEIVRLVDLYRFFLRYSRS